MSGPSSSGSPQQSAQDAALLNSPFAKMLGPSASAKQIQQAINQVIKDAITQIRKDQAEAVDAIRKMRKVYEGDDDS
jgi:hypothetical protein